MVMAKLQAIVEAIEALPAVAALSARVYGGRVPGGRELFPAVEVTRVGGEADTEPSIDSLTVDVKCYADSLVAADALYDAVKTICGRAPWGGFGAINELKPGSDIEERISETEVYECVWATMEFVI